MELYLIPAERADELYHYGVKGMKWGERRAQRYDSKASKYRTKAKEYNHNNDIKKFHKYKAKADKFDNKARLVREGKSDIKKLRKAARLKGSYIDTQGMLRGPYADVVGTIKTQKGERYAATLLRQHRAEQVIHISAASTAIGAAYCAGMYLALKN